MYLEGYSPYRDSSVIAININSPSTCVPIQKAILDNEYLDRVCSKQQMSFVVFFFFFGRSTYPSGEAIFPPLTPIK